MKLQQRATESGQNPADYAKGLLARDLERPQSLRELFAPVRDDIQASGVTEEELEALFEEAREEAYQEKQGTSPFERFVPTGGQGKPALTAFRGRHIDLKTK